MLKQLCQTIALSLLACGALIAAEAPTTPAPPAPPKVAPAADAPHDLKIGEAAPDFSLIGIDDKTHTLAEYKDAKILVVAFLSNHCPDSHAAEPRLIKWYNEVKDKGVTIVAINPNNPDGLSIDELGYSKYNDGFDDMKKYAVDAHFNFPYLYDGETQAIAKAYGCLATPHIFVFDAERKLRYKGQFDDSRFGDPATVKTQDVKDAVDAMLAGKPVAKEVTKPHGCSTKWLSKKANVSKLTEKWNSTPVDVEPIDAAGIAALKKNGTKKLRLFNVWSTSCGPCRAEFPQLVTTARKFGMREFEMITISTDEPKDKALVKEYLEKQGAGLMDRLKPSLKAEGRTTNSYVFSSADTKELWTALDPEAPGAIPHSVLVSPSGEILWRHNGAVDGDELRAKILEILGAVYKP
jgi:thiol-disulfide isomerase/thioredoxin